MHHVTRCHAHFVALAHGVGSREAVSYNGFGLGRVSTALIKIKYRPTFHHRWQENTPSCFDKLQIGSFNIASHSWRWTELFPILLHSRRRHVVTTTTAFVRLWSPARIPVIRRSTVGSRTFTVSGAAVWNDLPAHVTAAPSLAVFRQRLKTVLFSSSYPDIVI